MTERKELEAEQRANAAKGGDEHITEPINASELAAPPPADEGGALFNHASALERALGNDALLKELAQLFIDDVPTRLDKLKRGAEQCDAVAVEEAAHALKGAASHFSARPAAASAQAVETSAHLGAIDHGQIARLERAILQLVAELAQLK